MQITAITQQARDKQRVNVSVDGTYSFSLDIAQVIDLGVKVGRDYSQQELDALIVESAFGKLYARALEYVLMRPHSAHEVRQYLWRKTRDTRLPNGGIRKGVPLETTERVFNRLTEKGYIDDEAFARHWIENRRQRKGISRLRLEQELRAKGVDSATVQQSLADSQRSETVELRKMLDKYRSRYDDERKLIAYLQRQGFSYDDITSAIQED